eukprot:TRINITY_DN11317_c0_g1_i1.p1 TRINITY_DN11317_c0_g1~~TRINITY_DN11317_c0_g1_i1.p1  ORF type:complete len:521 (+),score=94.39 TRINITY_DN11317_c0_g1_i1:127-1689(+)
MRCFVRIEGQKPFMLLLDDDCSLEFYRDIVDEHYRSFFDESTTPPELVLIRCVTFSNKDRLLDFRQRRAPPPDVEQASSADDLQLGEYFGELGKLDAAIDFAPNPSLQKAPTENVIARVTLSRLIRLLCDPMCDEYTDSVFWAMFTTFTSPSFVLERLLRRFDEIEAALKKCDADAVTSGSPAGAIVSPMQRALHQHVTSKTRERIVMMLERWLEKTPWHFDRAMIAALEGWSARRASDNTVPPSLLRAVRAVDLRPPWQRALPCLPTVRPPAGAPPRTLQAVQAASNRVLAEQLHYASSIMYDALAPEELLHGHHENPAEQHMAPHVTAYKAFHRRVANWVTHSVVSVPSLDERIAVLRRFVFVAEELRRMDSWDILLAVYSGLHHRSVLRLQDTRAAVQLHCAAALDVLGYLFNEQGGMRAFKGAIEQSRRSNRPHIPCVLVYLRDVTFIERQELPTTQLHVRFSRAVRLYNLVEFLLSQQHIAWGVQPDDAILTVWETWKVVPEDVLEALSYNAEPP